MNNVLNDQVVTSPKNAIKICQELNKYPKNSPRIKCAKCGISCQT